MHRGNSQKGKHLQSINKIFTDYDDKIRSASPQPSSPYPSARFAIHRPKSPNAAANRRSPSPPTLFSPSSSIRKMRSSPDVQSPTGGANRSYNHSNSKNSAGIEAKPLAKARSLNSNHSENKLTSPVPTIGSMFNPTKQSSIADLPELHRSDEHATHSEHHISVPTYNTNALLSKFESETKTLNEICTNYSNLQQTFAKVISEQNVCIQQLLQELEKKNKEIHELKTRLDAQSNTNTKANANANAVRKVHSFKRPQPPINNQSLMVDEHHMNSRNHQLYSNSGMNGHTSHNNVTRTFQNR